MAPRQNRGRKREAVGGVGDETGSEVDALASAPPSAEHAIFFMFSPCIFNGGKIICRIYSQLCDGAREHGTLGGGFRLGTERKNGSHRGGSGAARRAVGPIDQGER